MVFEHLPQGEGAFRQLHDLLVPSGKLIVVSGDYNAFTERERFPGYETTFEKGTKPGDLALPLSNFLTIK